MVIKVSYLYAASAVIGFLSLSACSSPEKRPESKRYHRDLANFEVSTVEVKGAKFSFVKITHGNFTTRTPDAVSSSRALNPVFGDSATQEASVRTVVVDHDFEIGIFDVTQGQFFAVNEGAWNYTTSCSDYAKAGKGPACANNPVEDVTYNFAKDFARKLTAQLNDGFEYRLPTSAEWEYAARAGTKTDYFEDDPKQLRKYAYFGDAYDSHPVGQKLPNDFGLYDVLGSVKQLVEPATGDTSFAIARGCAHDDIARTCNLSAAELVSVDSTVPHVGFRLVRLPATR